MLKLFRNFAPVASIKLFFFNVLIKCPKWTTQDILFNLSLFTTIRQSVAWYSLPLKLKTSKMKILQFKKNGKFTHGKMWMMSCRFMWFHILSHGLSQIHGRRLQIFESWVKPLDTIVTKNISIKNAANYRKYRYETSLVIC